MYFDANWATSTSCVELSFEVVKFSILVTVKKNWWNSFSRSQSKCQGKITMLKRLISWSPPTGEISGLFVPQSSKQHSRVIPWPTLATTLLPENHKQVNLFPGEGNWKMCGCFSANGLEKEEIFRVLQQKTNVNFARKSISDGLVPLIQSSTTKTGVPAKTIQLARLLCSVLQLKLQNENATGNRPCAFLFFLLTTRAQLQFSPNILRPDQEKLGNLAKKRCGCGMTTRLKILGNWSP